MKETPSQSWVALVLGVLICSHASAEATVGELVEGHPFRRYSTVDALDRRIHFFLSEAPADEDGALPLVVFIQGTGCSSHFRGREGRILAGLPSLLRQALGSRARVLAVEKPGVEYLDDQGDRPMQEACRPEFAREHTLERWTEAIAVAVRLSNVEPSVTHAASLSAGGPNHLFVFSQYVRERGLDPEQEVFACWDRVQAAPNSDTRFCLDHPYRHWSSFFRTSLVEESLESAARLYFVHGSDDRQNPVEGFDVLRAELTAKGRPAVFERLEGASHSLDLPGQQTPEGLLAVFARLGSWFEETR